MAKATWNGVVIAESDDTIVVEGNHYFPASSVHREYLQPSSKSTVCPWKGTASYYTLTVNGKTNRDAAWFYTSPRPAATNIAGRVAFWRGVTVSFDKSSDGEACDGCAPVQSGAFAAIKQWFSSSHGAA